MPDIVVQPVNSISITVNRQERKDVAFEDSSKLKFTWRGQWLPTSNYSREDVVRYQGSAYVCLITHTATSTFDFSQWDAMVQGNQSSQDIFYKHIQSVASDTWVIAHNLGKYPSVTVVDSSGSECEGHTTYNGPNQLTISFSAPFSGIAYLN